MSNFNPADSGYVEVKDRIEAFYKKFPEGSLQSEIVMLSDVRVVVKAVAYRFPEDDKPGIGHSGLTIPGTTSFTKGSELENAETSAWGRAIAALGFEVKRSIATSDEIRTKQSDEPQQQASAAPAAQADPQKATQAQKNLIRAKAREAGLSDDELKALRVSATGKQSSAQFTKEDVDKMLKGIESAAQAKAMTGGEVVG